MEVDFRLSLIAFQKKVSMTKINIGSKDVELNIDEGFSWVSCDIETYEGGSQAFLGCFSQKSMKPKNEHMFDKKCFNNYDNISYEQCSKHR
jgi:hypothetical protein